MLMISVYFELLDDVSYVPYLYPNLGVQNRESILFLNNAFSNLDAPYVQQVNNPEQADYILLPHNYSSLQKHVECIDHHFDLAKTHQKKLLLFWHGDSDRQINDNDCVVVRTSQYRYKLRSNELIMPAYAEDLLQGEVVYREKREGQKPIIGFCGWARYKNLKNRWATFVKNACINLGSITGHPHVRAHKKGLWYRIQLVERLKRSAIIDTNFAIRSSYSGHKETIRSDAEKARQEYRDTLINSDYALVVKGDGNYSYRFYEALSLGRIPVFLDTECVLPFEDMIDYDQFIVRISYKDLPRFDQIVADHYRSISNEEFVAMQRKAREAYVAYLRVPEFFAELTRRLEAV